MKKDWIANAQYDKHLPESTIAQHYNCLTFTFAQTFNFKVLEWQNPKITNSVNKDRIFKKQFWTLCDLYDSAAQRNINETKLRLNNIRCNYKIYNNKHIIDISKIRYKVQKISVTKDISYKRY